MGTHRIGDIEKVLMGLEEKDVEYLQGKDINLLQIYLEAMNSIRSILGFLILVDEDDIIPKKINIPSG